MNTAMIPRSKTTRALLGLAISIALLGALAWWDVTSTQPAISDRMTAWQNSNPPDSEQAAALFSYGDFGALDLDVLKTSAVPWTILAASLALQDANGNPDEVTWGAVQAAFKRFGFLYPASARGLSGAVPPHKAPYGLSVATVKRTFPPLRLQVLNIGCAACHAGPAYNADGRPDPTIAIPGMPNTSVNLELFTTTSYNALKAAIADKPKLLAAIDRLFPNMGMAERLTLRWLAIPAADSKLKQLRTTIDRPVPFRNGAPGLTNGVAALKHQFGLLPDNQVDTTAGFVSIPVLSDRFFRSALLADGAYAPKGKPRFNPKSRLDAANTDPAALARIASFFLVPSMGMSDKRANAAIPDLTKVLAYLRNLRPPRFPGPIDKSMAATGRKVYAQRCSKCHGVYDDNLDRPQLQSFPNWAGDVGTNRARVLAFSPELEHAIKATLHGRVHMDATHTGKMAAPLLSGLWTSAPYFANGSIPSVRHILEPKTRPQQFTVGGHALDLENIGIASSNSPTGSPHDRNGYKPYSKPVTIDTRLPGFSNHGHEAQVDAITPHQRDALIEYLKLL